MVSLLFASCVALGCTPINDVNRTKPDDGQMAGAVKPKQSDAATLDDPDDPDDPEGKQASVGTVVKSATPCEQDGVRACEGHGVRELSICKNGVWTPETPCKMNERCDSTQGKCAPVAAVCAGQEAGTLFCDGDRRLICDDLVSEREIPCDANELCNRKGGKVSCTCAPGAVPAASGEGCEVVSGCGTDGSGCDPLTRCESGRCTLCPPGYVGDGTKGCIPQLDSLAISCGPDSAPYMMPLTSGVYEYSMRVPVLCQRVTLTAATPSDTQLEVDGMTVEPAATYRSPLLHIGDNPIKLVITAAKSGRSSSYQLTIERAGSKSDYLKASNAETDDSFGFAVAAEGTTLLASAPFEASDLSGPENNSVRNAGAAYVFELEGEQWVEKQILKAESPREGDMFGLSAALAGDLLVIGAPRYNIMLFKVVPPTEPGTAYVFARQGGVWKQEAILRPDDGAGADMFGFHVAVHGETVLVGAPYDSQGGSQAGAVYSFTRSGGAWPKQQKVLPTSPIAGSSLGVTMAIEGDTFVAGAMQDSTAAEAAGSAYIFARSAGVWSEQEHLQPPSPKALATFGTVSAIKSGRVVVTAPGLDLRQRTTPAGEAFMYQLDPATSKWTLTGQFRAAAPRSIDLFGGSVALTESALLVGANGDASSSRGIDGDPNRTDAPLAGAVYMFGAEGSEFVQSAYLKAFNAEAEDNFGHSAAATESFLAIGAPFEGGGQRRISSQDDADGSSNSARSSGAVYVYR